MLELVEPSEPVMRLIPLTVHGSEAMNVYAVTCDVALVEAAYYLWMVTLVAGLLYVLLMFFLFVFLSSGYEIVTFLNICF